VSTDDDVQIVATVCMPLDAVRKTAHTDADITGHRAPPLGAGVGDRESNLSENCMARKGGGVL
jgi:hypothetical protein